SEARNFLFWSSSNHGSTRLMCSDNVLSILTVYHITSICTSYLSIVPEVDFETVWGQGHTQAERSGGSTENFISWVNDCLAA
ncbi:MAG: hypothetical protein IJ617_00205, partial [Oscillospiraceae bacterium]|nr:hypothetical protein [Oscillospiraceae bacterium]